MIDGFKIVANTAAGRRRYMQYLIPQVVASDVLDRYDIWVNTNDKQDIAFFRRCAEHFPKLRLVWQPDGVVEGIKSINAFYRDCVDEDTIYIKLDDDIVWLEPDFFEKMGRFRIDNPDYFVVSPLVINNAISSYIMQIEGRIALRKYRKSCAWDRIMWSNPDFAWQLHDWFLPKLEDGSWKELYCGTKPTAMNRFSINSIAWFGREFARWGGEVPGDDEEFLSCIKPTLDGKACCFNGDCLVSHFAFFPQRGLLDKKDILGRYGRTLRKMWADDPRLAEADRLTQEAMEYVEREKEAIMASEHPYTIAPPQKKKNPAKRFFSKVFRRKPVWLVSD